MMHDAKFDHALRIGECDNGERGCVVCQNEFCYDCNSGPHDECASDCGGRRMRDANERVFIFEGAVEMPAVTRYVDLVPMAEPWEALSATTVAELQRHLATLDDVYAALSAAEHARLDRIEAQMWMPSLFADAPWDVAA